MAGVKRTAFQKLQKVKRDNCAGKATTADLNKAVTAYVTDAVAKGKPKAEATASAERVKKSGCPISGVKRRRTTTKTATKATTRRRAK